MSAAVDDALWSAIGDPTRRRMLDLLLAAGSGTATSLSSQLPVTRQAVAKHLTVLDRAGLVHGVSAGRERHYRIDADRLARGVAQLTDVGAAWDRRLRRIKQLAEAIADEANKQAGPKAGSQAGPAAGRPAGPAGSTTSGTTGTSTTSGTTSSATGSITGTSSTSTRTKG